MFSPIQVSLRFFPSTFLILDRDISQVKGIVRIKEKKFFDLQSTGWEGVTE